MLADSRPDAPPVTVELQTGDQPIAIEARDGMIHTRLGPADNPDVRLSGPPRPIMGLLLGRLGLGDAEARGVSWEGDPAVLDRIRAEIPDRPVALT